jgi:hypothetical protein
MNRKAISYLLFAVGVLLLEVHTTFAVFWQLSGNPAPYPFSQSVILYYSQGFTPILGAFCLLVAGLVYEKSGMTK